MNAYDVNRYNVKNSGVDSVARVFPKDGNKYTRSFDRSDIDPKTKTCLISITDSLGGQVKVETLWFTFDGSTPKPDNGHKMGSKGILELAAETVLQTKFSNQPGQQNAEFRLRLDQLTN